MSWLFTSGGQSIGVSASVLPMNIQDWFPKMDWLDLLEIQGTLKSLLQHHGSNESIFRHSAFFMVHLSYLYMTPGKTVASIIRTSVGKVMSLLFNMLSQFVIAFLPRGKHLLISWLTVTVHSDFAAQKNKICHYFHIFPIYLPWSDGTRCHDLRFLNVKF